MKRPISNKVRTSAEAMGQQLLTWRKLLGLTTIQLSERAGISRNTLRRVEQGDPGVSLQAFLSVARGLGVLDAIVLATDPYETDLGRARADQQLPQRVRS